MINCIVFDLDGTICNHENRVWLIPEWDLYHEQHIKDEYIPTVHFIWQNFQKIYPIIVMTGRPEYYRKSTELQLEKWGLEYSRLYMRQNTTDSNAILKWKWCQSLYKKDYKPILAFDDNPTAIAMFKESKISTMEVCCGSSGETLIIRNSVQS